MRQVKIIVEKHAEGCVAYPLGMKGVVVGEGSTCEEALADVKSAIRFHIETSGADVLPDDSPLLEAFIAEATHSNPMAKFPVDAPKSRGDRRASGL
jgi:predicted RNase H-like HicB family nuclease